MATIKEKMLPIIGSDKIAFSQMDWTAATEYNVGRMVFYSNNLYKCKTQHTSTDIFDPTQFEILVKGLQCLSRTVVSAPDVLSVNVDPGELEKPYVLKKREDLTWREAVQSEEHLENTDYTVSYSEDITQMSLTFHFTGEYKIYY